MMLRIHGVVPIKRLAFIACALGCGYGATTLAEPAVRCACVNKPKRQREQDANDDSFE
jgi:hypothetical protein